MEETNEMIEHEVIIDNYLSATIKIPKKLSAVELKGIFTKVNKLFNISETPIIQYENITKRPYVRSKSVFNPEVNSYLEELEKNKIKPKNAIEMVNNKFGENFTYRQICDKLFAIRQKTKLMRAKNE